jgi:hypothetical protein
MTLTSFRPKENRVIPTLMTLIINTFYYDTLLLSIRIIMFFIAFYYDGKSDAYEL